MELQEIDVVIDKDGKVRLEVRGAKGTQCLDLTQPLEQALDGKIESREMTSEAVETVQEVVQDRQKQGH